MLTVACVLRSGGLYTAEHVRRLESQVARHLTRPYLFVCLTDEAHMWRRVSLFHDWPGWWSKIELFRPGLFEGRVLYLDLDVTVVGPLDDLADYPFPFSAIADYQFPLTLNSSVMAWDAGVADGIYTDFTPAVMARLRGDQNWIHERQPAMTFPKAWCPSYRAHVQPTGKVPADARVVVFHGRPKPWEIEPLVA